MHTLQCRSPAQLCCCLFPKITSPCMGRPQKTQLLPRHKAETESLPSQERREHPDKCLRFGRVTKLSWERGGSSLRRREVGSGIRKLLSSSGSPGLAPGHQSPTPRSRSVLKHKQIDTECSVPAPWFFWLQGWPLRRPPQRSSHTSFTFLYIEIIWERGCVCIRRVGRKLNWNWDKDLLKHCGACPFLGSVNHDLPYANLIQSSTCTSPLQESEPYPVGR